MVLSDISMESIVDMLTLEFDNNKVEVEDLKLPLRFGEVNVEFSRDEFKLYTEELVGESDVF